MTFIDFFAGIGMFKELTERITVCNDALSE